MKYLHQLYHQLRPKVAWIFIISAGLVILTIALQEVYLIRPDEVAFLKVSALIRHNILHLDPKPEKDSVIFINVSHDPELIPDTDKMNFGGQLVITDRDKLGRLFLALNKHSGQYKFLLCDVLIDLPSPCDSILKPEMQKLKTAVFAADSSGSTLSLPLYTHQFGAVTYQAQDGTLFTKMPIFFHRSLKSLPAVLYEQTAMYKAIGQV